MDKVSPNQVANFFIKFSHEHGDFITNLKLQKLVYYAQAWHLALHGEPLFDADFQAWVHGPVCPALYGAYKSYGWNPISANPTVCIISDEVIDHLTEVYEVYGQYSGFQLEQMTHSEAPWIDARGDIQIDEASTAIISKQSMRDFYSQIARD